MAKTQAQKLVEASMAVDRQRARMYDAAKENHVLAYTMAQKRWTVASKALEDLLSEGGI